MLVAERKDQYDKKLYYHCLPVGISNNGYFKAMNYPPRRYPRKMKKQFTRTSLDFTTEEYASIYKSTQVLGMRPQQYVQYALRKLVEETEWNAKDQ